MAGESDPPTREDEARKGNKVRPVPQRLAARCATVAALSTPQDDTMPTDDKKSTTKKPVASKAKPAPAKKPHKAAKPSNSFLAENPPPRMRGNRK
jgi:hypothetical protein